MTKAQMFANVIDFLPTMEIVRLRSVSKKLTKSINLKNMIESRGIAVNRDWQRVCMWGTMEAEQLDQHIGNCVDQMWSIYAVKQSGEDDSETFLSIREFTNFKNDMNGLLTYPHNSNDLQM